MFFLKQNDPPTSRMLQIINRQPRLRMILLCEFLMVKITFLDVLDYSEYSDTNISNFFSPKHRFLNEEAY